MIHPVTKILKRAKSLIRRGWTQGSYARNRGDTSIVVESPNACKFCLRGAVERAHLDLQADSEYYWAAQRVLEKTIRKETVIQYNDKSGRKKDEILKKLDMAITRSEKLRGAA